MELTHGKGFTLDDIYNLPEGERAELIDGQIYYMAPPSRIHQLISSFLHGEIYNYIRVHKGLCEVYAAPFAVFLTEDAKTYIEPDISVICDKDKLDEKGCHGAPDWIIEIVSPSSRRMDYYIKLNQYQAAGAREYWLVDAEKDRIIVYDFVNEQIYLYNFKDTVKAGIYEDLSIDFSELEF